VDASTLPDVLPAGSRAIVTGAASGIGLATARRLLAAGAEVLALDLDPAVADVVDDERWVGRACDVSDEAQVSGAIAAFAAAGGPITQIVSNAGIFTAGANIVDLPLATWRRSLDINLTSHLLVLQAAVPHMVAGGSIVIMGSRNVLAPGPGAAAYSCAKAAATQLARVAALELAPQGIRVNVVHPDAVFDTGIWTPEVLQRSADRYGMTVEEYKTKNLLKAEISQHDVAAGVVALLGPTFGRTTGAQVPIDGGNDRVI
jgi:NAD(P)-dependent dehydrogenase (short-subunit alcohol dehydrogenase family)